MVRQQRGAVRHASRVLHLGYTVWGGALQSYRRSAIPSTVAAIAATAMIHHPMDDTLRPKLTVSGFSGGTSASAPYTLDSLAGSMRYSTAALFMATLTATPAHSARLHSPLSATCWRRPWFSRRSRPRIHASRKMSACAHGRGVRFCCAHVADIACALVSARAVCA